MRFVREMMQYGRRPAPRALDRRGPLRVMFVNTSMPVGGAETLLMNLMRRVNRDLIRPEFCCLKDFGPVGEELLTEFSGFRHLLAHKYDIRVLPNLIRLFGQRRVDAVVTVGAGDKMFWGRLAGWLARVPVVASALHSTGWPDTVGWLNRRLTPITDAFIAVAPEHGRHMVLQEGFPADRVRVIPNGVDTARFCPAPEMGRAVRAELGIGESVPVCGIVAALRPEKNVQLLLEAFRSVVPKIPAAQLLVVGDGPERTALEALTQQWELTDHVHFLGTRRDIPAILNACDLFALSSRMEANPVSILEALACGVPVVAPHVGSIPDTVRHHVTGRLVRPLDASDLAFHLQEMLRDRTAARAMGEQGRRDVLSHWTLQHMVDGYTDLIREIYQAKSQQAVPAEHRSRRMASAPGTPAAASQPALPLPVVEGAAASKCNDLSESHDKAPRAVAAGQAGMSPVR